ncbi:MAG: right-handed parallel beta-helix repeat-containing protein [Candidatus Bathyarchaeales archaeon]
MDKSSAIMLILLLLAVSCYVARLPVSAGSKTIVIPDDYATLEAAVQHASSGDTVYVRAGRHKISNDTLIINKQLAIIGEAAESTILIGPGYGYEFFPYPSRTGADKRVYKPLSGGAALTNFIPPSKVAIEVNADNFRFSHVTIEKCDIGIAINGNGATVAHTKMPSASVTGSHALISDNTIVSISVKGDYQNITRNQGGLSLACSFSYVAENKADSDMWLLGSFNIIAGNSFSTLHMEHANSNIICNNSLICMVVGDYGHTCSNNTICKNRFIGPWVWGILMGDGLYNVFHDNLVSGYGYGIALGGYGSVAEHNLFYRNILVSNRRHVSTNWEVLGAGNLWDNGEEGNYWDDYNGTDANGDGIGDTPYIVRGVVWNETERGQVDFVFGQDNYPLMASFDIDSVAMELPEWALRILDPAYTPKPSPPPSTILEPSPTLQPQSSEFPPATWVAVAVSSVAIVGVGTIFYLKKSRKTINRI